MLFCGSSLMYGSRSNLIDLRFFLTNRSMTDLVSENSSVAQSPKRKFSFRFPNLSHHSSIDKDQGSASTSGHASNTNTLTYSNRSRNFSEEIKNVPDLQVIITKKNFHFTIFLYKFFVFDFFFHFSFSNSQKKPWFSSI